jgi:hypothetical protein
MLEIDWNSLFSTFSVWSGS